MCMTRLIRYYQNVEFEMESGSDVSWASDAENDSDVSDESRE